MFYMYAPLLEFLASNDVQVPGSQKQRSAQSQISAKMLMAEPEMGKT